MRYAVTEANAIKSSYVCLQSIPVKENDNQAKIFYPIMFSEDPLEYLHGIKVQITQESIPNKLEKDGGVPQRPTG